MTTIIPTPVGVPKRVILDTAFEECSLAGYEFDREPEEITMGLRRLNMMMAEYPWNQLAYEQPDYGQGLPEDLSGLPTKAVNAVAMHLALRIAPALGRGLAPEQRAALAVSRANLFAELATIPAVEPAQTSLRGAGWRFWRGGRV